MLEDDSRMRIACAYIARSGGTLAGRLFGQVHAALWLRFPRSASSALWTGAAARADSQYSGLVAPFGNVGVPHRAVDVDRLARFQHNRIVEGGMNGDRTRQYIKKF